MKKKLYVDMDGVLVDFETGIQKTVQWYLNHQDWVATITNRDYRTWISKQYT